MNRKHSQEESRRKQEGFEEQKISADDLKFMRSAVEKTDTSGDPDWLSLSVVIMWGLICLIGYNSIHFLVRSQYYKWIWPMFYALAAIGSCYSFIGFFFSFRNDRKAGFVPYLPKQIIGIWVIALINGFVWSILGKFFNTFICGDPGFIFAMLFCIALGATGILDSKIWFLGSILIFAGMMLTYFVEESAYIILGLATGAGLIMPAIIAQRNYRKQEKENAQA